MRPFGRHGRQLSVAEHLEIRPRIAAGQTFAAAASAVGCSTKSIQRLMIRCGGLPSPVLTGRASRSFPKGEVVIEGSEGW
jgi:hypothetical protein